MVLICFSLMVNNVEQISRCLFVIHMFSLLKYLFGSFVHYKNCVFLFLLLFVCSGYKFLVTIYYKYFFLICSLPFNYLNNIILIRPNLSFFKMDSAFEVMFMKFCLKISSCFLLKFILFHFILIAVIHFELFF